MSILARIQAHGGDIVRDQWRFTLKPGRLTPAALTWLRSNMRWFMACCEVWPVYGDWAERAAICEFGGGMTRSDAEAAAYREFAQC